MLGKGKNSFIGTIKNFKEIGNDGFCLITFKVDKSDILETNSEVKSNGNNFGISLYKGQQLIVEGYWTLSNKYGEQFVIEKLSEPKLNSFESIEAFLKSGLIKGIGPKTAIAIIETFGLDVIDMLDENPSRLLEVPRIGRKTLEKIKLSWEETRTGPKIIEEITNLGFPEKISLRIYKIYKNNSLTRIKETPYSLLTHVYGLSFELLDSIALKNGVSRDDSERIRVCLDDVLSQNGESTGNTIFEKEDILNQLALRSKLTKSALAPILDELEYKKKFKTIIKHKDGIEEFYLQKYEIYQKEKEIVFFIRSLLSFPTHEVYKIKDAIERTTELALTDEQKQAMIDSMLEKINIINGGPGVGKTTVLKALVKVFKESGYSVALCAPTGKAAKRMSESAGMEAKTIHRALEYNPINNSFIKNNENKLDYDVVVVDEFSMVDIHIMSDLIKAIKQDSHFIMLGDVDQLPSVGMGALLRDMISSGVINVSKITKIQRQAADSKIIKNAYKVNSGDMVENFESNKDDFFFLPSKNDKDTLNKIRLLVGDKNETGRIEKSFGFNPIKDVQILVPEHDGLLGTTNLNKYLQELLNPIPENNELYVFNHGDHSFRVNDNVMQMKNDHENKVYNGDAGVVSEVRYDGDGINILFQGKNISMHYAPKEFKDIKLAYAITIHKSQGSEYPVVIIPISHKNSFNLDRSLIYTAITRGKKKVIMIGSEEQIKKGIQNTRSRERVTNLLELLQEEITQKASDRIREKLINLDLLDDVIEEQEKESRKLQVSL